MRNHCPAGFLEHSGALSVRCPMQVLPRRTSMKNEPILAAALAALAFLAVPTTAQQRGRRARRGSTCTIAGGAGFIIGSEKDLRCAFNPADETFAPESYFGGVQQMGPRHRHDRPSRDALAGAGAKRQHLCARSTGRRLCRRQRGSDGRGRCRRKPPGRRSRKVSRCSHSACRRRPA